MKGGFAEECDDGNLENGDGCDSNCQIEDGWICTVLDEEVSMISACQVCGNSLVEGYEQCDDGNTDAGDGCNPTCVIEANFTCNG